MKFKILTYVVLGLTFFLSAILLQWYYYESSGLRSNHSSAEETTSWLEEKGISRKHRLGKLGLSPPPSDPRLPEQQYSEGRTVNFSRNANEHGGAQQTPLLDDSNDPKLGKAGRWDPAIILFCYDR